MRRHEVPIFMREQANYMFLFEPASGTTANGPVVAHCKVTIQRAEPAQGREVSIKFSPYKFDKELGAL